MARPVPGRFGTHRTSSPHDDPAARLTSEQVLATIENRRAPGPDSRAAAIRTGTLNGLVRVSASHWEAPTPSAPFSGRSAGRGDGDDSRLASAGAAALTGTDSEPWSDGICKVADTSPPEVGANRTTTVHRSSDSRIMWEHESSVTEIGANVAADSAA
jgi:hypothetical protein